MGTRTIDAVGLRCPQPILQLTIAMPEIASGDIIMLKADCDSFEQDIASWCERLDKTLLSITKDAATGVMTATIQF